MISGPHHQPYFTAMLYRLLSAILFLLSVQIVDAGSSSSSLDYSIYGISNQRDWLYTSSSIGIKYEGCVWSYVEDGEDMGCMEDESEDGTTMWYMMANCKRAQVAYSVYASSSGSTSCRNDFKESMVTKSGVAEFAYTLGTYGYNSPISSNDVYDMPVCESDGNGYYLGVSCSDKGTFTIDRFTDAYCLQKYSTYDELSNFNSAMNSLKSCYSVYNERSDESAYSSLSAYLIPNSGTCSESESYVCTTSSFVKQAGSSNGFQHASNKMRSGTNLSLTNKIKYGLGSAMLLGSLIMFFGILFTNRRKRRALMHRKFRGDKSKKSARNRKSSSSRSKKKKSSGGSSTGFFA